MKKNTKKLTLKTASFIIALILQMFTLQHCFFPDNSKKDSGRESLLDLKVMTFNIRYGSADDGENSWNNRKSILFEVIRDFNPDIFGMQEVLNFQLNELKNEFQYYSAVGAGRDDGKTKGEYSPIFFAKDRFILDTTETFWYSDTPKIPGSTSWGNEITRICTWAKLFDKFSGKSLYVLNTHLDHISVPSRIKSAQALIAKIKSFKENSPIILTGDFNSGENEETIKSIKNFGLTDTYRSLHAKSEHEGTFNGFTGDDTKDKIDFIFTSNNIKAIKSDIIKTNKNGKYPSDHFPVTAVLIYK